MTLRPEYSLGHSTYNTFLFAEIGEDRTGAQLTVLSALTRLGFDPWKEAARLADLPRDVAATALAAMIAKLPQEDCKTADPAAIAQRLVGSLPGKSAVPIPRADGAPPRGDEKKATVATWLVWGTTAAAVILLFLYLQPDRNLEPGANRSWTSAPPSEPPR